VLLFYIKTGISFSPSLSLSLSLARAERNSQSRAHGKRIFIFSLLVHARRACVVNTVTRLEEMVGTRITTRRDATRREPRGRSTLALLARGAAAIVVLSVVDIAEARSKGRLYGRRRFNSNRD